MFGRHLICFSAFVKFLREIIFYCRCCPGCGKSYGRIQWLCSDCEYLFISRVNPQSRLMEGGIIHYYLVDWYSEDTQLTRLVHSLKGCGLFETYTMLVQLMLAYFPPVQAQIIFYPSKGEKDHAFQLARLISEKKLLEMRSLLKTQKEKQALLNRTDRKKLTFAGLGTRVTSAFLVDDIVTSGATVRACYEALNRPSQLTVWSLFYRKDL